MKGQILMLLAIATLLSSFCLGQKTQTVQFSSTIDRLLKKVESDIITTAEAMPAEKFDFTPDSLHLPGAAFDGVRTFSGQIMHLATDNILIWAAINNQKITYDIPDVNGPKNIKTKEDVLNYLKYSFEIGQKAIETITAKTAIELVEFRWRKLSKLDLAFYGIVHANEHYGQMVVYLRMCGIVPPPTKTEK
ncbi:MAG: DinB family protein [Chitinophagaceae bacterium]